MRLKFAALNLEKLALWWVSSFLLHRLFAYISTLFLIFPDSHRGFLTRTGEAPGLKRSGGSPCAAMPACCSMPRPLASGTPRRREQSAHSRRRTARPGRTSPPCPRGPGASPSPGANSRPARRRGAGPPPERPPRRDPPPPRLCGGRPCTPPRPAGHATTPAGTCRAAGPCAPPRRPRRTSPGALSRRRLRSP